MIKPNWDIFKAKFKENHQNNFEWFCYLLFCKEFNQPQGIFRYFNHSGMETNPVKSGDESIAWEAKFYEDKLSNHKDEFINKLEITKRKNPETTKIVFYTPIDWTESSKKAKRTTKQQDEIEKCARNNNIEIVWRGASFFESEFVSIENEIISKHFFTLDKSVFDLIKLQQIHSENILNEIQTSINFCDQAIEIDRSKDLAKLNNGLEKAVILSGAGGVGKTAIVKKLYDQLKEKHPFYIFKATEFELRSINDLFPGINFQDFVVAHNDENKIIVIDSAEKLLDLKNADPFKEFLRTLIQNNWKLIFTTRDNYLEDLNFQFFEIYKIIPLNINISNLEIDELNKISNDYKFLLPKDEKLLDLLKNPFYLSEYLKFYKADEEIDYVGFKEKLWNKIIKKSKPAREQCFLKIAFERANEGQFFINPSHDPQNLVYEFKNDGILGYESPHGYFITHDIYEEWALEKNIESEFIKKSNNQEFFKRTGQSLPIRRSFRNWLSEKLLLGHLSIKDFIDEVIKGNEIESHWKDATLIAVLLSDYSDVFFELFKENLKANNCDLLKRITFLLRIACKEVDDDFFKQLGVKNINLLSMKYVLTKPKGKGWQSLVKFVFENLDEIGIKNIFFVLPIIHDWNSKVKEGATTRYSSLIALHYYQWTIKEQVYFDRDGTKDNLLQTILYGSSEIKNELKEILEEIIKNKWKKHRDPYYDLSKFILTKYEAYSVFNTLPKNVLQLANLFWLYTPVENNNYDHPHMGVEHYFGIEDDHLEYFPESAYQTPIYWLLQSALRETIDFILSFTNETVESYAKSDLARREVVEEVEVFVADGKSIKQYISNRLWCTYRGTQVSPHVLESIHMALEKFFIERGEKTESKALENWLLYLIRNSKSASISAIVASVVLAYPEKTFNIAKVLFQTKEFYQYDTARYILDLQQKNSLLMLKNGFGRNYEKEFYENERLEACDDKNRKFSLEHLFFNYQYFLGEGTSEDEAKKRQEALWEILDNYYKKLPNSSEETETDKTWRLFLARMDRRKMKLTTEKKDGQILINFNPEIDLELKKYSETSLKKINEPMRYTPLKLWAAYKLQNDDKYKTYEQYEKNPQQALKEVQDIISELEMLKNENQTEHQYSKDDSFYLFNHTIPADVCAVLVKDHFQQLSKEEQIFCKDIILEVAILPFHPNYQYQISDGTQSAMSVLPFLIKEFPEEKDNIKITLLFTLFNEYPIDMGATTFSTLSTIAVHKLRESKPDDAESILFGYLLLKSKYEQLRKRLLKENHRKGIYELHENQIIKIFLEENEISVKKVVENKIFKDDLEDITKLDLNILRTAFLLIPPKTDNNEYKEIVKKITCAFAKMLLSRDKDDKIDYRVRHDFLKKYSHFVLNSPKEEILEYLKPFLDGFNSSEAIADLFEEFILIEDSFNLYENFWEVWNLFENKIIELCKKGDGFWYVAKILKSYLFAQTRWKETTINWHTLKDENKIFFKEMSEKLGHCSSVLYAISKLLNDIGSPYLNDGISWLSGMLEKNKNLLGAKLENNTIYYLENLIRKYIYKNREKIRKTKKFKGEVLIILDFLIEKGSVVGYMLRENIL